MQKYLYLNRLPNIQASFKQLTGNSASSQKKTNELQHDIGQDRLRDVLQDKHIDFQVRGSSAW